jgi:hypothetical protein
MEYLSSIIGNPLFLDCTIGSMSISKFTRICIQTQVNKEISKSMLLDIEGKELAKVEVELSWKPPR